MRKTVWFLLLAALLLGLCAGCRLARPDAAEAPAQDRLIGVYVTREGLDLFDMESYLRDNAGRLTDGGGAEIGAQDQEQYGGRLWARQTDDGDWVFDGLDGFGYYAYRYAGQNENGVASHLDEGITGGGMHVTVEDAGERVELRGTVYVTAGAGLRFYCNPVYQTVDGAVYCTEGHGAETAGALEGESTTMTLRDAVTVTENGESRTDSFQAEICFELVPEPVRVALLQMDADSRVLRRDSYAPGQVPESLTLEPACAYVVAETEERFADGRTALSRQLKDIDPAAEQPAVLETYCAGEDGLCLRRDTALTAGEARP